RGIGRAIAEALAQQGASVAVTARSAAEVEEVVHGIARAGGRALALVVDLVAHDAPAILIADTLAGLGPIDILVNNAGIGSSADPKPIAEYDDAFWERTLTLNLTVPYRLC